MTNYKEELTFKMIDPKVRATLCKNALVKLQFGTFEDAEQFFILICESARTGTHISMKFGNDGEGVL